jgi:alkaline phosphatase D
VQALDRNLVVLAGDTHNAWASDLTDLQGRRVGVEFATPSVTSPGFEAYLADIPPAQLSAAFPELVDPLVYCDTSRRGFMVVTATAEQVRCDWYYVAGITTRQATASLGQSLRVLPGAANRVLIPA